MTEPMSSMGGLAVAAPPEPLLPEAMDDAAAGDNRRKLLLVAGGVGALLVLVAGFFLLQGGGSSSDQALGPVPHASPAASVGQHKAAANKPVTLPKSFKGHVGRDPFKPLYVAPVAPAAGSGSGAGAAGNNAAGGSSTTAAGGTGTSSGTGTTPVVVVPPSTTGSGTTPSTGTGSTTTTSSAPAYKPVWVKLVKVSGTNAAWFVVGYDNGRHRKTLTFDHVLAPSGGSATVFAKVFALLAIHGDTATVKYGDGTPFDLNVGEKHFVS